MYLDINVKRTKYNKGSGVKTYADVAGLHLRTPTSNRGSATVSVTGSGPQVTASNRNFSATVSKQVKSLAAHKGKARIRVDSNSNIGVGYGPVNVSHSPHGNNPEQGKYAQVNLNIPTGRRNK